MQHLSHSSRRHQPVHLWKAPVMSSIVFFALHRIKPHAHRLCGSPVTSFEPTLRPYFRAAPLLNALAPKPRLKRTTSSRHRLRRDYQWYLNSACSLTLHLSVSLVRGAALRHRYSSRSLRYFTAATPRNSTPSAKDSALPPGMQFCVEPGISHPDLDRPSRALSLRPVIPINACTLPYYRGCWHGVSWCFFCG